MAIFGLRTGSWGTPELGLTEAIGSLFGAPRTAQGGSNLFGGTSSASTGDTPTFNSWDNGGATQRLSGGVLGASTTGPTLSGGGAPRPAGQPGLEDAARQGVDAELGSALSEFDYNRGNLLSQQGELARQREIALQGYADQEKNLQNRVSTSRTDARNQADSNQQDALATAQETQRKNRMSLRALGILNSTAAGEMLSKPLNEYDKVRAQINQNLSQRMQQLDDFMNEKVSELSNAKQQVESQYTSLVDRIQNDLRFNDRQRADAVRSANSALQQRLAEIRLTFSQYQSQVGAAQANLMSGLQQLDTSPYQSVGLSGISDATVRGASGTSPAEQVAVFEDPNKRKGLLSAQA